MLLVGALAVWLVCSFEYAQNSPPNAPPPTREQAELEERAAAALREEERAHPADAPLSEEELATALRVAKRRKAPGPDGLPHEFLIHLGPRGKAYLIGSSYYPEFAAAARPFLKGLGIEEGKNIDKFAFPGSDHFPFHQAGVPALDFWAGVYKTMNTLQDVTKDINREHLSDMTRLGYLTILNLANRRNLDLSSPSKN